MSSVFFSIFIMAFLCDCFGSYLILKKFNSCRAFISKNGDNDIERGCLFFVCICLFSIAVWADCVEWIVCGVKNSIKSLKKENNMTVSINVNMEEGLN